MEKEKKKLLPFLKEGIQREWKKTKEERQEYLTNSKGHWIKKVPNILTRFRILGSFVIPPLAFIDPKIAIIAATGIALTDFFDGVIARNFDASSKYGALLDTIADKLLSLSLVCALAPTFPFLSSAILMAEVLIMGTNIKARIEGIETKSSPMGKVKTWILSVATIGGLLAMIFPDLKLVASSFLTIALGFQVITVFDYNIRYFDKEAVVEPFELEFEKEKPQEKNTKTKDYTNTSRYWKQEKENLLNQAQPEKEEKLKKV